MDENNNTNDVSNQGTNNTLNIEPEQNDNNASPQGNLKTDRSIPKKWVVVIAILFIITSVIAAIVLLGSNSNEEQAKIPITGQTVSEGIKSDAGLLAYRKGGSEIKGGDLFVYNPLTKEESQITNNGSIDLLYSWSPDGKRIVVSQYVPDGNLGKTVFAIVNIENGEISGIDVPEADDTDRYNFAVGWSNETTFRFAANSSIYEATLSSNPTVIYELKNDTRCPGYSFNDDVSYFAYQSSCLNSGPVYLVNLDESTEKEIVASHSTLHGIIENKVVTSKGNFSDVQVSLYDVLSDTTKAFPGNNQYEEMEILRAIDIRDGNYLISSELAGDNSTTIDGYMYGKYEVSIFNGEKNVILTTKADESVNNLGLSRDSKFGFYELYPSSVLSQNDPSYENVLKLYVFDLSERNLVELCNGVFCKSSMWED